MYLHIGNGESVKIENIIAIFDLDTATVSKISKEYISRNEKDKRVEYSDSDLPRSFIVVNEEGRERVILSRISTLGLKQRIEGKYTEN